MLALGVPSSSFRRMVPAVAVYLISCPPIFNECFVCTTFSSGTGGFFSSFGFSAALSGCGGGCCWAKQRFAPRKSNATEVGRRKERFMGGRSPSYAYKKHKRATCGIVSESACSVNRFRISTAVRFPGDFSSGCRRSKRNMHSEKEFSSLRQRSEAQERVEVTEYLCDFARKRSARGRGGREFAADDPRQYLFPILRRSRPTVMLRPFPLHHCVPVAFVAPAKSLFLFRDPAGIRV